MKGVLTKLEYVQKCVKVFRDSEGSIHLSKHQVFHERSKHVDVKLDYVMDVISSGEVKVEKILTDDNPVDMLTTCVPLKKFELCLRLEDT